ncbi:MAG TPA: hypothetical protein DDY13_02410 [Cytophagales bacterium]|jgi:hypothetical protein|nr:hypothetical protein [Cytophagales bacterium]
MNLLLLILIAFCFQSSSALGHEVDMNWTETEQYEVLQMPKKSQEKQIKKSVSIKIKQKYVQEFHEIIEKRSPESYKSPINFLTYARFLRHCSLLN